jgi:hypothetical protein
MAKNEQKLTFLAVFWTELAYFWSKLRMAHGVPGG